MSVPLGPHARFDFGDPRERFAAELLDRLWSRYRERVEYVRVYESVIADLGATFVNDHIAFRTLAAQTPLIGGASLSRLVEALGYRARAAYDFPDKHLNALHYEHTHPDLPKLFISELRTWELPPAARATLSPYLTDHRSQLSDDQLAALHNLGHGPADPRLLDAAVAVFEERPWRQPAYADVVAVNEVSQYAAWVLVHGYNVNHFTALINSHAVAKLDDIEKTAAALAAAAMLLSACITAEAPKQGAGTLLGAVGGALAGSQVGKGRGR
ncbi:MAG: DUF1338 family protein, partial [Pirellulaceae bacterium]|nr:DUF1338 family protein [Pirellulaceae bacterium]